MRARLHAGVALMLAACAGANGADDPLAAPPLTLVEEMRLEPNTEDFSVISDIGVGPHEQVAVLQPQDGRVILFDSTGTRLATIGRRGSGPGEFQLPSRAGWVADTMWVVDFRLLRTVHVGPDGAVLRTSALPDNVRSGAPLDGDARRMRVFMPIGVQADGSLVGEVLIEPADPRDQDVAFVRAPVDGPARIAWLPPPEDEQWTMRVDPFYRTVPFAPTTLTDFAQDIGRYAWLSTEFVDEMNGTITLTIVDAEGDTTLVRSYPFRPIGTFTLPPRATVRRGTRTHVWMTQRDEDDLVAVLRYRLQPAR